LHAQSPSIRDCREIQVAQFKIVGSRPTSDPKIVIFDVIYLEGALVTGDEFVVYDTHHPINCKVLGITPIDNRFALRCWMQTGIGWENQFASAIVDMEAKGRPASFRYIHDQDHR
jgi:hypothetical protein